MEAAPAHGAAVPLRAGETGRRPPRPAGRRARLAPLLALLLVSAVACGGGTDGHAATDGSAAAATAADDRVVVTPFVADAFLDSVVLDSAGGDRRVAKWTRDVGVGVAGSPTDADLAALDEAIAAWQTALDAVAVARTDADADVVVHFAPRREWAEIVDDPEVGLDEAGWTYTRSRADRPGELASAVIVVDVDQPQSARNRTIAHELGHALGLGHDDCASTLMHTGPDASPTWSPTELDLELTRVLYDPALVPGASPSGVEAALDATATTGPACEPVRWTVVVDSGSGGEYWCDATAGDVRPCVAFAGVEPTWPPDDPDRWAQGDTFYEYDPRAFEEFTFEGRRLLCQRTPDAWDPCVVFDGAVPDVPLTAPDYWTDGTLVRTSPPA